MSGYIKLHRSILDWEWWDDHNATRLLIFLLAAANYRDKKWKGITVKRGSVVISWDGLSERLGLSVQKCRTAMQKLEIAGEVTRKATNKYQVVSLVKWDKLQSDEDKLTSNLTDKPTDKQQTNNNQITTTKESKERKEGKEIKKPVGKEDVFDRWLTYRNEIKKPIKSPTQLNSLVKKFTENPAAVCEAVVNASIENGWQGLFWDRVAQGKKTFNAENLLKQL